MLAKFWCTTKNVGYSIPLWNFNSWHIIFTTKVRLTKLLEVSPLGMPWTASPKCTGAVCTVKSYWCKNVQILTMLCVTAVFKKSKPAMTHLLVADSSHFTTVPILVKAYRLVTVLEQTVRLCRPVVNLSVHLPWIKCVCQFIGSSSTVGCLLSGSLQPSLFFVKVCKVWIAECTPPSCKSIQKHVLLNVTRSITTIFSLVLVFTYPES